MGGGYRRGGYGGYGGYGGFGYWPYYGLGYGYGGYGYGGYGYGYPYGGYYSSYSPSYYYSSAYSYPTTAATSTSSAPYLTNQTYEPGDGYRYPLYYNPATGTYFYYPVRR
jgi:hypothetical protein